MQPFPTASDHGALRGSSDRPLCPKSRGPTRQVCVWTGLLFAQTLLWGCTTTPVDKNKLTAEAGQKLDPTAVQLIGDLTRVWGMQPQRVDGVSLVVGLPGTGSDPPPSVEREMLLAEMQRQEVDNPNSVLADPTTALVHVRGLIPPGAKKGDRFDIDVTAPRDSGAENLARGWLMESRLHEYASINGSVREGHLLALAQGDLLTRAALDETIDDISKTRGVVLGGGVVLKGRGFGLMVKDDFASVQTSSRIGEAINARFDVYRKGQKRGVAEPKNDSYVELLVHPTYQDNVIRYMRVIQNIAIRENGQQRSSRITELRAEMAQPSTAALAAIKLESMGADGIPVLKEAVNSGDAEIQFYAAEALAYQDEPDAVRVLGDAVRREPAFRYRGLVALGVMDCALAHEELVDLMNESSAETRYGAFRVLRKQTPFDPILGGKLVADKFCIHQVNTAGPPLIHVSRQERAEIVCFGSEHHFSEPLVLFVGKDIVVRSAGPGRATVRRLTAGEDDDQRLVSTKVAEVLETAIEFGASYADVVQALTESKRTGSLASRLEFSAIPNMGRVFSRDKVERSNDHRKTAENSVTDDPSQPPDAAGAEDWLTVDPDGLQAPNPQEPGNSSLQPYETPQLDADRANRSDKQMLGHDPGGPRANPGVQDHASAMHGTEVKEERPMIDGASAPEYEDLRPASAPPQVAANSVTDDPVYCQTPSEPVRPTVPVRALAAPPCGLETSTNCCPPPAAVPQQLPTLTIQTLGLPAYGGRQVALPNVVPTDPGRSAAGPVATANTADGCLPAANASARAERSQSQIGVPSSLAPASAQALAYAGPPHTRVSAAAKKTPNGSQGIPPSKPKSPVPPAPEQVLPGVDLLDLIDPAAPRRRF